MARNELPGDQTLVPSAPALATPALATLVSNLLASGSTATISSAASTR